VFDRALARLAWARVARAGTDPQQAAERAQATRSVIAVAAAARAAGFVRLAAEAEALLDEPPAAIEILDALEPGEGDVGAGGLLAKVVAGAPDAGHMLDLAIGLLVESTGAERGVLVLLDEQNRPTETAARNIRGEELAGPQFSYSRRLVQEAAQHNAPVLIRDALVDPRFAEAESVATLAIRSVLAIPVAGAATSGDPAVLAVLYLDDRTAPGRFGAEAQELARRLTTELAPALRLARERVGLERDMAGLRSRVEEAALGAATREIVGDSLPIRALRRSIERAARAELPVLIEGESGSGKELIARAIHTGGPRAQGPFVAESCAAVADQLLESELFGHVKGAFTGADRDREGIFAAASGGTLFLDEVNSMSPSMQAKLLRVLQERVVRAVGAESTRPVDVRVIAASNERLTECVAAGRFRQDLYYRLAVVVLEAPPLRERPDDVPLLVDHFLRKHTDGEQGSTTLVSEPALRTLAAYPWPGNVRELENAIRRLLALRVSRVLVRHLPPEIQAHQKDARPGQDLASGVDDLPLGEALERLERDLIARVLRRCQGNVSQAARALHVERTKLTRRIKKLGVDPRAD
jgi:DNA-binding NtrC family response regulator